MSDHDDRHAVDHGLEPGETVVNNRHVRRRVLIRAGDSLLQSVDDDQPRLRPGHAIQHEVVVLAAGEEVRHIPTEIELAEPFGRIGRFGAVAVVLEPRLSTRLHRAETLTGEEHHAAVVIDRAELLVGVHTRQPPLVLGVIEDVHGQIERQERLAGAVTPRKDADSIRGNEPVNHHLRVRQVEELHAVHVPLTGSHTAHGRVHRDRISFRIGHQPAIEVVAPHGGEAERAVRVHVLFVLVLMEVRDVLTDDAEPIVEAQRHRIRHREGAECPRAIKPRHERQRKLGVAVSGRRTRLSWSLRLPHIVEIEADVEPLSRGGSVFRGAGEHGLHFVGENVLAGADHLENLALSGLARRIPGRVDVPIPLVGVLVITGHGIPEHLLDLVDGDRRLRRQADLGHDERHISDGIVPGLAVPAGLFQTAEPGGGLGQLRVDVALRHDVGSLGGLLGKLWSLSEVLEVESLLFLRCRLLLAQLGLVLIELGPHDGIGNGRTLFVRPSVGAHGHRAGRVVLLVDGARQAEDARQVENRVCLKAVLLSDSLDSDLPAGEHAFGVG